MPMDSQVHAVEAVGMPAGNPDGDQRMRAAEWFVDPLSTLPLFSIEFTAIVACLATYSTTSLASLSLTMPSCSLFIHPRF